MICLIDILPTLSDHVRSLPAYGRGSRLLLLLVKQFDVEKSRGGYLVFKGSAMTRSAHELSVFSIVKMVRYNLGAFQRFVTRPSMDRPYGMFGRLMDLWCRILSSRLVAEEGNQEATVFLERTQLQSVLCLR